MAEPSATLAAKAAARALARDHIIKCHTPKLRMALVLATSTVNDGVRRHQISNVKAATLYGRAMVATSLMSSFLKGEERCIVQFLGDADDEITRLYAEAMGIGEVRGYATGPSVHTTAVLPGRTWWDGRLAVKSSSLSVSRILYDRATPQQSITALQSGDVEGDLSHWFAQSEQVGTRLRLEVVTDRQTGRVTFAGGVLLQRIASGGGHREAEEGAPGSTRSTPFEDVAARLARALPIDALDLPGYTDEEGEGGDGEGAGWHAHRDAAGAGESGGASPAHAASSLRRALGRREVRLASLHASGCTLTTIAKHLLPELEDAPPPAVEAGKLASDVSHVSPFTRVPLDFHCRCNKERFTLGLARLGSPLLHRMKADYTRDNPVHAGSMPPVTTLTCQFCNASYDLSWADVESAGALARDIEGGGGGAGSSAGGGTGGGPPATTLPSSDEHSLPSFSPQMR